MMKKLVNLMGFGTLLLIACSEPDEELTLDESRLETATTNEPAPASGALLERCNTLSGSGVDACRSEAVMNFLLSSDTKVRSDGKETPFRDWFSALESDGEVEATAQPTKTATGYDVLLTVSKLPARAEDKVLIWITSFEIKNGAVDGIIKLDVTD